MLERILSSHSQVYSAGELKNFGVELKYMSGVQSNELLDVATVAAAQRIDYKALGKTYIESTQPWTEQTAHFIDKLPFNYLYIGFIHRALPQAKIIHMRRNPMDTCFSNYKQMFANAYKYSYDLEELAQYYLMYRQLMQHWHSVLPGKILDVDYEILIENQESETQRVLEFCDLDWEDACLDFHKNKQAVATASASQVREPIYRSSLQKWRHYANWLQPLQDILEQAGVKC